MPRALFAAAALITAVLSATFLPGPGWAQPREPRASDRDGRSDVARRPRPVDWLPQPDDPDPMRGRPFRERLDRGAERFREATASEAAFPIDGPHDYGEAQARFGVVRPGHTHEGQDVFASAGTPLVAIDDGVILEAGSDSGRGNYVGLFNPRSGETYVYLHLEAPARVEAGDRVEAGERLGGVGCTGSCSGDHLHFEVRKGRGLDGPPTDPLELLRSLEGERSS